MKELLNSSAVILAKQGLGFEVRNPHTSGRTDTGFRNTPPPKDLVEHESFRVERRYRWTMTEDFDNCEVLVTD